MRSVCSSFFRSRECGAASTTSKLAASSSAMIDFAVIARGFSIGLFFVFTALWMAALAVNGARLWPWPVFAAAGALLNWVVAREAQGQRVRLAGAHRLVAAFLRVVGVTEHADVTLRS